MQRESAGSIELQHARELLLQKRALLLNRLDTRMFPERSQPVNLDERRTPGDAADSSSQSEEEDKILSHAQRANDAVKEVDEALTRVNDGTYGKCIDCGEPIDPERLRSQPEASRCLTDQEDFDRKQGGAPHARL
jgi:RNA polymerase-binding transcription factor DksA